MSEEPSARYANPTPPDIVEWLPRRVADHRLRYGDDAQQFGDLRLPKAEPTAAGHPVVVVIHGGGYSPNWPLDHVSPLAERLTETAGVATWNLEYRKPGQAGGGWPGTWSDIGAGIDHLRSIAERFRLDLRRVVVVGHSAGGTFGMWAASRSTIAVGSEVHAKDPVEIRGVVTLAGMLDLDQFMNDGPTPPRFLSILLGVGVGVGVGGGGDPTRDAPSPDDLPARTAEVSPALRWRQVEAPQALIIGSEDAPIMIEQSHAYVRVAKAAGRASITLDHLDGANHFDLVDSHGAAWPVLLGRVRSLLGLES